MLTRSDSSASISAKIRVLLLLVAFVVLLYYSTGQVNKINTDTRRIEDHLATHQPPRQGRSKQNDSAVIGSSGIPSTVYQAGKSKCQFMLALPWQQGGLGNQMFQVASLLGVAARHNRTPVVTPGCMVTQVFSISPKFVFIPEHGNPKYWKPLGANNDKKPKIFDKTLFDPLPDEHMKIRGFTQSFKYFQHIESEIKKEFRFHEHISTDADSLFRSIVPSDGISVIVGVHVRRGDFTADFSKDFGRITPSSNYFTEAMSYFRDKYKRVRFLVVTNGPDWARDNVVGVDVAIVPPASGVVHLAVLCRCSHVITSGGTYGWWAAYLAGGEAVYARPPYRPGSELDQGYKEVDYQLPTWRGLTDQPSS